MRTTPRRLGLLGGITWHSSLVYEQRLNEGVNTTLGGSSSADLLVRSYDFAQIAAMQEAGEWDALARLFAEDAVALVAAGAEAVMICANTMHKVADEVASAINVPLIHLIDATADGIRRAGVDRVALLGTGYTMRGSFYADRMAGHGIETVVPGEPELEEIHRLIYDHLAQGRVPDGAKARVEEVLQPMLDAGCQGVIAGCTEIPMVLTADDVDVPYFDGLALHVEAAVQFALAD